MNQLNPQNQQRVQIPSVGTTMMASGYPVQSRPTQQQAYQVSNYGGQVQYQQVVAPQAQPLNVSYPSTNQTNQMNPMNPMLQNNPSKVSVTGFNCTDKPPSIYKDQQKQQQQLAQMNLNQRKLQHQNAKMNQKQQQQLRQAPLIIQPQPIYQMQQQPQKIYQMQQQQQQQQQQQILLPQSQQPQYQQQYQPQIRVQQKNQVQPVFQNFANVNNNANMPPMNAPGMGMSMNPMKTMSVMNNPVMPTMAAIPARGTMGMSMGMGAIPTVNTMNSMASMNAMGSMNNVNAMNSMNGMNGKRDMGISMPVKENGDGNFGGFGMSGSNGGGGGGGGGGEREGMLERERRRGRGVDVGNDVIVKEDEEANEEVVDVNVVIEEIDKELLALAALQEGCTFRKVLAEDCNEANKRMAHIRELVLKVRKANENKNAKQ